MRRRVRGQSPGKGRGGVAVMNGLKDMINNTQSPETAGKGGDVPTSS